MDSPKEVNLSGLDGALVFRNLAEGLMLKLGDGAVCQIVVNPNDGAYLLVKVVEFPENPTRVGEEEMVYYTDVKTVYAAEEG